MNTLRHLVVNARPPNRLFNESFTKYLNVIRMGQPRRNFIGETYEGTGKTTGYILNKKGIDVLCVDFITESGFQLTNGWTVVGPTIFFPHTMLCWKIKELEDINEDSMVLFDILRPQLDCLFIGYGNKGDITYEKYVELSRLCKDMNIRFELLPTLHAASTFNFCSLDRRFVAAALIPPKKIIPGTSLLPLPSEEKSLV